MQEPHGTTDSAHAGGAQRQVFCLWGVWLTYLKTMQMDAGCTNACKALYNACLFNPHIISKTRSAR